jgi:hypothetical protein
MSLLPYIQFRQGVFRGCAANENGLFRTFVRRINDPFYRTHLRYSETLHPRIDLDHESHRPVRRVVSSQVCAFAQQLYSLPFRLGGSMLGFKSFENARVVIAGIEFAQKIIKRQYDLRRLSGADASHAQMWQRMMAA